ncbi:MAG: hypothetical protein QGG36_25110 [Pirellulaceae bacterium]|nr:hypothetical protein [Pirellulaceae bacterium]MDP7019101.1 hypothetical protein [Pirellulaceae bacterium]
MHVSQLVEIAAITAAHAPVFIRCTNNVSLSAMERYWTASKCRIDRWTRVLKAAQTDLQTGRDFDRFLLWVEIRPTVEEILASEILTRVWSATSHHFDRLRGENELSPMTRSVFVGHLEARNRALDLLIHGHAVDIEQAVELNRIRRKCERWTDMLLANLLPDYDPSEFCFDERRTGDFAADMRDEREQTLTPTSWNVVMTSLRASFGHGFVAHSPNADLNDRIANSVNSSFQAEMYDSTGVIKTNWMLRLENVADDSEGYLNILIEEEERSAAQPDRHFPRFNSKN